MEIETTRFGRLSVDDERLINLPKGLLGFPNHTRFGRLSVEDERIITFPNGLLGFPDHNRFALIQTGEENYFFWLQAVEDPNLAFVVTDPTIFFKDYEVPLRDETLPAGTSRGVSNVFAGIQAVVSVARGCLIAVHPGPEREEVA